MKVKSISGLTKSEIKGLTTNHDLISDCKKDSREGKMSNVCKGNKLVTTEPWFCTSQTLNEQNLSWRVLRYLILLCLMTFVYPKYNPLFIPMRYTILYKMGMPIL